LANILILTVQAINFSGGAMHHFQYKGEELYAEEVVVRKR
jgi:hypothetical protein